VLLQAQFGAVGVEEGLVVLLEFGVAAARSQCFLEKTGTSEKAQYRWSLMRALFNLILAIPLSACPTTISAESNVRGGVEDNAHESAATISGSMMASSSNIRSQMAVVFEPCLSVASKSITNCVAEVIACCDCKKTGQAPGSPAYVGPEVVNRGSYSRIGGVELLKIEP